ncbi:MAG: hypothetical protein M3M95_02435 [Pseudomonadota bacterium]|nr:hypothetical protein [Pseudomonadota bacterium]
MTWAPLLAAPVLIQLHVALGTSAFAVGAVRLICPDRDGMDRVLGWSFLTLLLLTAGSAFLLPTPTGAPSLMGLTPMHAFAAFAVAGAGAAVLAAQQGNRLRWRKVVTATFSGVLVMAGLFELLPGRLLHTVLAGS